MEIWIRKYDSDAEEITMCYKILNLDSISFQYNSPISASPLPEEGGDKNMLVKVMGNTNTMNISWTIKEETSNVGNSKTDGGGYTAESKSIMGQMKWFTDPDQGLLGTGIEDRYDVCLVENGQHGDDLYAENIFSADSSSHIGEHQIKGFIRSLTFDASGTEPVTFKARMDFIEGDVITGYSGNTPSQPRNFYVKQGNASGQNTNTELYAVWNHPQKDGGSSITRYAVYFRESAGNGNWSFATTTGGSTSAMVLQNLTTGTNILPTI